MVNGSNTHTLLTQADDLNKLVFVLVGIYIYEFAYSLPFDWTLVIKDDSERLLLARSVKWLYFACRYSALTTCFVIAINGSARADLNCEAVAKLIDVFGLLGVHFGTLLLFVRVGVVWHWNKRITVAFTLAYISVIALGIRATVIINGANTGDSNPFGFACTSTATVASNLPNALGILILDLALLIILLAGLWRWGHARAHSLWHILWNQGLLYLTVATIIEIPPVIFLFLNDNPLLPLFFSLPFTVILPIAATRLYRSLMGTANRTTTYESTFTTSAAARLPKVRVREDSGETSDIRFASPGDDRYELTALRFSIASNGMDRDV